MSEYYPSTDMYRSRRFGPANQFDVCTESTNRSHWHTKISKLYDHWLSISPAGCLPGRQHFDPLNVVSLLPNIALLDVVHDPIRFRFRLFGTRLTTIFKSDPTGKFFHDFFGPPSERNPTTERFHRIINERVVIRSKTYNAIFPEETFTVVESLNMPLAKDGHTVDMILGILVFTAPTSGREI